MKRLGARMPGVLATWMLCVLTSCLALATAVHAQPKPLQQQLPLPLPELGKDLTLRVAYVHNPRFEALPAARLEAVLALAANHLKEHLGLGVAFTRPAEVPIIKAFAALDPRLARLAETQRLDAAVNDYAVERLARGLLKDLKLEGDLAAQRRFAEPYLLKPPQDASEAAFARALIDTQLGLLRGWQLLKGADGQPLIGKDRFNEYTYWNVLGSTQLPYEVIVTNQVIASAEWEENSVHSAVRGGVSNGITTQSRAGRFQLYSVLSTFPFLDDSPQTVALRGGDRPTPAEADNYMALILAHELGHQLLHLGHPFANPRCLMAPPPVLRFRQWAEGLSATGCRLGSSRENTPGVVKFLPAALAFK